MESALEHVRALAQSQQSHLASRICDHYARTNGHEISLQQLHAAFDRVRDRDIEYFELVNNDDSTSEEEEEIEQESVDSDESAETQTETESNGTNEDDAHSSDSDSDTDYDPQFDDFDSTRDAQDRIDLGLFPDDDVLTSTDEDESEYSVARESVVLEVLSAEMQSALQNVRKLGKQQQKEFLAKVCDAYEAEQEQQQKEFLAKVCDAYEAE